MEAIHNEVENHQKAIDGVVEKNNKAISDTFIYDPYVPEHKEALFNGREDDYFPDENDK